MDEKNKHGRIFKKLREERGYKSKDVAGDVISTRTLTRFEADETSLSIATFEKLLENCGILPLDYLAYYIDNIELENTKSLRKLQSYLQSGSVLKLVMECKKELKKRDIEFSKRLDILTVMRAVGWKDDSELFLENRRLVMEKIESINKLGWDDIGGLKILISIASRECYTIGYIDRIIDECLHKIPVSDYLSKYLNFKYCGLLNTSLAFLSRNGHYNLAEKRCKDAIKLYERYTSLLEIEDYYIDANGILAMVYLRQNKKEGVELANKVLKYQNMLIEVTDDSYVRERADLFYKAFYKVNKTGIDFEF